MISCSLKFELVQNNSSNFNIMKNRKLYESIQKLVNRKESERKNKRNFVQQYCTTQLKKKKLLPKTSTSRIDELMKNFRTLKTYVNVGDLMDLVHELYIQQEKKVKNQKRTTQEQNIRQHRKYKSQSSEPAILGKASNALKEYRRHQFNAENQKIGSVLTLFQKDSNYLSDTMQNKQKYGFITQLEINQNRKKQKNYQSVEQQPKQAWNQYAKSHFYVKTEPSEGNKKIQENKIQTEQNYKKKKKMFDLAQIYLQLILEEQHKKKWDKEKNIDSADHHIEGSLKKKPSILRKSIITTVFGFPQKDGLSNHFQKPNPVTSINQLDLACHRSSTMIRSKPRPINQKEIAIRKVNNFLIELEEDENSLKKERKLHLSHLTMLEKNFDEQNQLRSNKIWKDQEKYEQIKLALEKQNCK